MTAKRKMTITMNAIEFSEVNYDTRYAMICHTMTRIDTLIAVCFLLLLFAVGIVRIVCKCSQTVSFRRHKLPHHQNAWIKTSTYFILADGTTEIMCNYKY